MAWSPSPYPVVPQPPQPGPSPWGPAGAAPQHATVQDYASNLSGMSDADLNALVNRLSSGAIGNDEYFNEMGAQGLPGGRDPRFSNGGAGQGALTGAATGAAVGSVIPGLGTVAGGVIGGVAGGIYGGISGTSDKERRKRRAAVAARNAAYDSYLGQHNQALDEAKQELAKRGQIKGVNDQFAAMDPMYQQIEGQQRSAGLNQLQTQYQELLRQSSLAKASKGLAGSSVDAESRGDLQSSLNSDAIGVAQGAHNYAQSLRAGNEQQREQMVGQLSSGNPYNGTTYQAQLQQIVNQTHAGENQTSNQLQGNELSQYGNNLQSQALGGAMSNLGNLYRTSQMNNAYGSPGYGDPSAG